MTLLDSSSRPHLHRRHKLTDGYMDFSRGTNLLQMVQRHFEEQKIEQLDMAELTQVQHQLDAILRQTRIKKLMKAVTALHEEMDELVLKAKLHMTNWHFLHFLKDYIILYRCIWKILG
ncbi:uncharacterized protein LOC114283617 [Camellia sinensis]|uniref:uncharacterized protein LOC114283617 n=1 Tax=Camellia sinensis TaxID=4442 RepID=UPI00103664DC|nr:uncharacterized protein LOC114283617 [Camellia sinensis]